MAFRLVRRPNRSTTATTGTTAVAGTPGLTGTRRLRTAGAAALVVGAALAVPTIASASPNVPIAPRIHSARQQLAALAQRNDQIVEKYNQADVAYHAKKAAAAHAGAVYRQAQGRVVRAEQMLALSAAQQYEGGTFSTTGALLSSNSGSSYLDKLDSLSLISQHNSQVVSSFAAIQTQAKQAKAQADNLYAQAAQTRAALGRQRSATQVQIDKYKKVLSSLTAQQRAMWAARQGGPISASAARSMTSQALGAASARAQAAVRFALAQVGKPYVFGAAGPSSFDCSGLTMAAWQQGGVSLPHSALNQYSYGHHVPLDQLQPGDLVFLYQPIAHVTIYIGNGMMVSAPEPGENVQVVSVQRFANDIVGATRLAG
ncbi:MAG TPA: C40 family peptidase [Jatrophihabitans sp.]|jgi:cell wall-associated NlpC family hydrolase